MAQSLTERLLDRAHAGVVSLDVEGVVTYWNPSAERMFGIERGQALGRPVAELIIPERFRAAHWAGIRRFLADGVGPMLDRRVELAALRGDGTEFPIELTITALEASGQWTFTAFVQDIAWRKEAERERERLVEELREAARLSERRFDAIVGSLSDPVTIRDRHDRLVYANPAALAHLGVESLEEFRSATPEEIMGSYRGVYGEDGREISMSELPSVRILRGEPADPLLIRTVDRHGKERWSLLKAAPLLDEAGEPQATIMVTEDVTEQQHAKRRSIFLARVSEVLASSLDYEQTLRNVAELAVPEIADWCAVDLLDEDGDRVPVAVAHSDPERLQLAAELREYEPTEPDPNQGLGLVLRTGEPLLYPEIPDELLVEAAVDDRHLELLRSVGMRSGAVVPMRVGDRTLGALTLVSAESGRVLDASDLELARQIGARAAVAIENSRLYSERARIAHTLQQSLLTDLPEIPGYELASLYLPAVAGTEAGGDFYDAWQVGEGWMITIGDVTGKGVHAAALTALVRHTLRAMSEFVSSPAELLARLDGTLKKQPVRSLCTALCLRLEGERAMLAAGGHPLPLYITAEGVTEVGEHGPLLGGFDGARWSETVLTFEPGATLISYTDGVTDAIGESGERYGLVRLSHTLDRSRERSARSVIDTLASALEQFQSGAYADDIAALALRRLPVESLRS
jgi:PAS domain S-box-containing protein